MNRHDPTWHGPIEPFDVDRRPGHVPPPPQAIEEFGIDDVEAEFWQILGENQRRTPEQMALLSAMAHQLSINAPVNWPGDNEIQYGGRELEAAPEPEPTVVTAELVFPVTVFLSRANIQEGLDALEDYDDHDCVDATDELIGLALEVLNAAVDVLKTEDDEEKK